MAKRSAFDMPLGEPTAMELAAVEQTKQESEIEVSEHTRAEHKPVVAEEQHPEKPKPAKSAPKSTERLFDSEYAFFEPGKQKESRVTRTFTLPFSVDQRLTKMAALYGTQKSVIIERAFTIWADNMDKRDKVD